MEKPDKAIVILELVTTIVMSIVTLIALALLAWCVFIFRACAEGNCL